MNEYRVTFEDGKVEIVHTIGIGKAIILARASRINKGLSVGRVIQTSANNDRERYYYNTNDLKCCGNCIFGDTNGHNYFSCINEKIRTYVSPNNICNNWKFDEEFTIDRIKHTEMEDYG